jgi:tetratricopeptide (TPR) repeat protein
MQDRDTLQLYPAEHPNHVASLRDLAIATRFLLQGNVVDLEEVIKYYREALQLCPPEHPNRSIFLNNLANVINTRFDRQGNIADLEEAIMYHREALQLRPPGHFNRASSLIDLAHALRTRFEQQGTDLDEAIRCNREALQLCPPGHPNRSHSLIDLASALKTRFEQQDSTADLEEAIRCCRESLQICPPGHPNRPHSLDLLARGLRTRFEQRANIADLEEAIKCNRESLQLWQSGHPHRFTSLIDLANALQTRFTQHGNMVDLEEAIKSDREALEFCPPEHPSRFTSLVNLSLPLQTRFSERGNIADLDEAIKCNHEALQLCPSGHASRYHSLVNLSLPLQARFLQQGNIADLDEAVKCNREALQLCSSGHPNRYYALINLANTISIRFEQLHTIADLDEVIKCHRESLQLCPPGHPNRYYSLNHLANVMKTHFEEQGIIADLDEAIIYHREALQLCPPGHPNRFSSLLNLANDMRTCFEQQGDSGIAYLEEAIECNREALQLCPPGHYKRALSLGSLADAISTFSEQQGNITDLQEAIQCYREALDIISPHHPLHTTLARGLAKTYIRAYHFIGRRADLDEAFRLYSQAAEHNTASSFERFRTSLDWIFAAHSHSHESRLRAYSTCLSLLQQCTLATPSIWSQHDTLARAPKSLASDAAACAIEDGRLETAVELLEQGRSILWSRLSGYRRPLDKLREFDGELAKEFEKISRQLESTAVSFAVPEGELGTSTEDEAQKYRLLSESWNRVVARIRQIPEFSTFLEAEPFANLQKAAVNGPVIIVNISEYRSDALIIRNTGKPILVRLPDATPDAIQIVSMRLAQTLKRDSHDERRDHEVAKILREIWGLIVSSVVGPLRGIVADGSRIWWCPTSTVCSFPLHGAGPWKGGKQNLPDIFISSYTPTLAALARAHAHVVGVNSAQLSQNQKPPRFLAIGVPKLLGYDELKSIPEELAQITKVAPHVKVLQDENATHDAVIQDLPGHSWVHFSCHGEQDITHPFNSSFRLHDSPLSLYDITQARLSNPEFAFLSACHTATGAEHTPDETIHLAAGLQFAGFQSVIGTLWAMVDTDGPAIAKMFYQHMFRETGKPVDFRDGAEGLNITTQKLRKLKEGRLPKDRWVNFIHIGV